MAITKLVLDRQAEGRVFPFGTTAAGGEALVTLNKGAAGLSTVLLDVKASASIAGDLNLIGNLNITGVINETAVTNLAVADINITLNRGGTTTGALNAGLFIEGDTGSFIGKLLFDNTLTSKFKIGDGTTQVEIVTVSGAQTLTGKSISGAQITSAVALATNVTTNANLTGVITSAGNVTSIGSQTGTGNTFVVQTSPTLVTPNIGAATGTSLATSGAQTVGTAGSVNGDMVWNNATNAFTQTFRGSNPTASIVYILPTTAPTSGQVLSATTPSAGSSTMSWASVGTGSVTSVSVVTANGISGTVATATSTPAITLVLGAITPTTVNGNTLTTGTGTLTLGANTLTVTANASIAGTHTGSTSGSNTGDQTITLTGDITGSGTGSFATTLVKYQRKATVTGTQDATNKIFTIGAALKTGSEQIYLNGGLLDAGATNDYVYDGATTITFQAGFTAPISTDKLTVFGLF